MAGTANGNELQYTGREADTSGLYYYRARYYSPTYQRFLSEDPIGFAGGVNGYQYANGNPLRYVDPLGLWSFTIEAYAGFGGMATIGYDSTAGQWFYGGGIGIGLGGGFSIDPDGRRPGAEAADNTCNATGHGTTYGTNIHAGLNIPGIFSYDLMQATGGYDTSTGNGFSEGPSPAPRASLTRGTEFSIGGGAVFEVRSK